MNCKFLKLLVLFALYNISMCALAQTMIRSIKTPWRLNQLRPWIPRSSTMIISW